MLRLLRVALQVILFFLLLSLVMAVAAADTGAVEKVALIAAGAVLVARFDRAAHRRAGTSRLADAPATGCAATSAFA